MDMLERLSGAPLVPALFISDKRAEILFSIRVLRALVSIEFAAN
jgi:hypothetical protein